MGIFFFFHWHYSPLLALACRTMSSHFFLSATNSLHLLTPSTGRYPSTSSFHLLLDLPYPPPFSLSDLTSLSFALLSILLYFLLCLSLVVWDPTEKNEQTERKYSNWCHLPYSCCLSCPIPDDALINQSKPHSLYLWMKYIFGLTENSVFSLD